MELAIKIHHCLTNGSDAHEVLDLINEIKNKNLLARINEFFMEHYNRTPNEYISDKFRTKELYAISSTLKYIREPNESNTQARNKLYQEIGYIVKEK